SKTPAGVKTWSPTRKSRPKWQNYVICCQKDGPRATIDTFVVVISRLAIDAQKSISRPCIGSLLCVTTTADRADPHGVQRTRSQRYIITQPTHRSAHRAFRAQRTSKMPSSERPQRVQCKHAF